MRTIIAFGLMLLASACDRHAPPDLVKGLGAPAIPTSVALPAPAQVPAKTAAPARPAAARSTRSKASAAAKGGVPGQRASPVGAVAAPDPCAGLDGRELDDCLGFDAGDTRIDADTSADFAREQRRRDRELLERDASEAAERARSDAAGDDPSIYYDEREDRGGPVPELDPETGMEPDPAYEEDYAPPGQDDPPPDDGEYDLPPDDGDYYPPPDA